jgi:hypothetical protein
VTIDRATVGTFLVGIACLIVMLYCFSGYAMNASFSVAHPQAQVIYGRRAALWLIGASGSFVAAIASFVSCSIKLKRQARSQ